MSEEREVMMTMGLGDAQELVSVTPLGSALYRVYGDAQNFRPPLFSGDLIEAREIGWDRFRFLRVVHRSDPAMVVLEFDDGSQLVSSLATRVTPVGDGRYRLEETEWMHEPALCYHDIIEAEHLGEARLRYIGVAQRSDLKSYDFVVDAEFLQMTEVQSLLGWVGEQGGFWQNDWGGLLIISIPTHADTDFLARWDQAEGAFRRGLREGKIKFKLERLPDRIVFVDYSKMRLRDE